MSSVYLDAYIDNSTFQLERYVPKLEARTLSWREIQGMTTQYRQRGVCSLLLFGTPDRFFINMMQSAGAFLAFLKDCPDDQKVTSQAKPFFDALGAGYASAAREIAANSRDDWNRDLEYEEEFLYAYFLMRMLFLPGSSEECADLVERLAAKSTPADAARLQVCRGLQEHDSGEFNAGVVTVLEERNQRVTGLIQRGTVSAEMASWLRHFANEGLALVRLAEMLGLETEPNYLHVPEQLRPATPYTFDPHAWRSVSDGQREE